ncbi:MAG TPA: rod shape-determining protein MreC, partial [Allosphingosinicella sp.]
KALLGIVETSQDKVATGRIVGSSFDSSRRLATLSVGSASGVEVGQPVRGPEGLIGRVIETGRFASRILLVTDGASNIPVQLVRTGIPAIATGRGDGTIEIKPLEVGQNPFRKGDVLVTSGTGGIFPPHIPVAMVVRADRDSTIARPLANPARVDYALVQKVFMPAANAPLADAPPEGAP